MEHKNIYAALVAAQSEFTPVAKDRENPYFKSEYATLLAVVGMIRPILAKHGLGYVQDYDPARELIITKLVHASGEVIECLCPFACADKKPQGYGSALTYFRRYALQTALGIVVCDGTDDDGNQANGNPPKAETPAKTQKAPPKAVAKPSQTAPRVTPCYDICPCGKAKGKKWVELDTDTLKTILGVPAEKAPQITNEHRAKIFEVLTNRETSQSK